MKADKKILYCGECKRRRVHFRVDGSGSFFSVDWLKYYCGICKMYNVKAAMEGGK